MPLTVMPRRSISHGTPRADRSFARDRGDDRPNAREREQPETHQGNAQGQGGHPEQGKQRSRHQTEDDREARTRVRGLQRNVAAGPELVPEFRGIRDAGLWSIRRRP